MKKSKIGTFTTPSHPLPHHPYPHSPLHLYFCTGKEVPRTTENEDHKKKDRGFGIKFTLQESLRKKLTKEGGIRGKDQQEGDHVG